ncbi:MAG: twin-arginine translocation signal domain-containing protein, partial [Rhodanobacteraceae bacterium]
MQRTETMPGLDRRKFLTRALTGVAALALGGCDRLSPTGWFTRMLGT